MTRLHLLRRSLGQGRLVAVLLAVVAGLAAAYVVAVPRHASTAVDAALGDAVDAANVRAREVGLSVNPRAAAGPSLAEQPRPGAAPPFDRVDRAVRQVAGPDVQPLLAEPSWAAQSEPLRLTRRRRLRAEPRHHPGRAPGAVGAGRVGCGGSPGPHRAPPPRSRSSPPVAASGPSGWCRWASPTHRGALGPGRRRPARPRRRRRGPDRRGGGHRHLRTARGDGRVLAGRAPAHRDRRHPAAARRGRPGRVPRRLDRGLRGRHRRAVAGAPRRRHRLRLACPRALLALPARPRRAHGRGRPRAPRLPRAARR